MEQAFFPKQRKVFSDSTLVWHFRATVASSAGPLLPFPGTQNWQRFDKVVCRAANHRRVLQAVQVSPRWKFKKNQKTTGLTGKNWGRICRRAGAATGFCLSCCHKTNSAFFSFSISRIFRVDIFIVSCVPLHGNALAILLCLPVRAAHAAAHVQSEEEKRASLQ